MSPSAAPSTSAEATLAFDVAAFQDELAGLASKHQLASTFDAGLAAALDSSDALSPMRQQYILPSMSDAGVAEASSSEPALYLCGNSLGPLSRRGQQIVTEELGAWGQKGVLGHWDHPRGRPWTKQEERVGRLMSDVVGAKPSEVTAMATLTGNLHTMLSTFYRPAKPLQGGQPRHKIIYEARAFPSDQYALASAVALAGFDPRDALVPLHPRSGESTLRTEDVLAAMEAEKEAVLVMMGGIQYFTGQLFDISTITRRGHELGLMVGWDLAHAFANVPLALHDWDVDFAVWCTYKYGSSGPGGIAGVFVHERWGSMGMKTSIGKAGESAAAGAQGLLRPAGWWGHKKSTRFTMPDSFDAMDGAAGWQTSNPSMLDIASLLGSLETLAQAPGMLKSELADLDIGSEEHGAAVEARTGQVGMGLIMPALRTKSVRLTAYLEHLLTRPDFLPGSNADAIEVLTPREPSARGSQLSIRITDRRGAAEAEAQAKAQAEASAGLATGEVPPPIATTTLVARAHKRAQQEAGLIADVRNPDVMRLAPLAQFSTFADVHAAAEGLRKALLAEL
ncbi:PLP-dependent transferase [Tilletiopsis washingtonensis]|uniref:Kynureninase n=1 Tax=Tilletiopsis washingtonensis TaxID=58919 RepID=A0A316ZLG9_9BASI|nr:PLP-dependent transferase [Tilletiopsis washingtonensis]PWO01174.1 PLP-dependent transferase [Tilletiopsis washingtonensis]